MSITQQQHSRMTPAPHTGTVFMRVPLTCESFTWSVTIRVNDATPRVHHEFQSNQAPQNSVQLGVASCQSHDIGGVL